MQTTNSNGSNSNPNGGASAPVPPPQSQQTMLSPTKPPLAPRSRSVSPVPPGRPANVSHQNRNVSWGGSSIGTHSAHSPLMMQSPRSPSLTLNDVLQSGPHEMEAETHILRAVEKITGQAHQKTNTETFELFGSIAEDEVRKTNLFTDSTTAINDKILKDRKAERAASSKHKKANSETTSNAESRVAQSRFQGLVQKVTEKQTMASKGNGDSTNNVEHELFGLTSAMNDMGNFSRGLKHKQYSVVGNDFDTTLTGVDKIVETIDEHVLNENGDENNEHRGPENSQSVYSDTGTDLSANEQQQQGGILLKTKPKKKKRKLRKKRTGAQKMVTDAKSGIKEDFELFQEFVGGKKQSAKAYARKVVLFIMLPSIVLAAILFYFVEDPLTGPNGVVVPGQNATASWWILFIGSRMVITLTMALITQALIIDYFALGSRFSLQWVGPIFTLLVVQSKGWPFVSIWWGTYNLILLSGDARYVRHWFYFQNWIGLFNEDNPGNNVVDNDDYIAVLWLMVGFGMACAIKRLAVGLLLGKQTFAHFGQELATVMKSMVLIGEVATLAREIEKDKDYYKSQDRAAARARSLTDEWKKDEIQDFVTKEATNLLEEQEEDAKNSAAGATAADAAKAFMKKQKKVASPPPSPAPSVPVAPGDTTAAAAGTDGLGDAPADQQEFTASEQFAISELLDAWEEPKRHEESEERKITIGAIMQFRQALSFMKRKYPFLPAFGPADSRERCIESSQAVYDRLLLRTPYLEDLPFETLALLAKDGEGGINQDKARHLIKLFRPERDGSLGKLEFVKSIDSVYKQLRLLSANITNSSQIDKAIEGLINFIFYFVLGCIALSALGGDPMAVYLSFSSVFLGFSFMFGASAAKYFEGVLFILVQRPYGVGDRIHLSVPNVETSPDGSSGWIVEKITLNTTTVYWGTTNERATINNGAISNLRVINAARSPNATVYVELKFGIDTPYEKIAVFRTAVEQFLKDRPREWLTFIGFRPTEVAVDRGYLGYKIIAQHRNHWQGIGGILTSKADLTTYCLEVAKQLEIRYQSPPLPVDLSFKGNAQAALQAIQPGATGLDQAALAAAMSANSPGNRGMRGQHEAFGAD